MRTLAIDLGTKRIGLALSDAGGKLATPHDVLEVSSPEQAFAPILELIEQESVERIVIGLPLNMDGTHSAQTKSVINWSNQLKKRGPVPLIFPLIYVDERLSSFEAEQQLSDRKRGGEKITRKSKKQMLDALVAANLLQEFLDGKLTPIRVDDHGK